MKRNPIPLFAIVVLLATPIHAQYNVDHIPDWVSKSLDVAQVQAEAMLPHVLYQELLPRSIERGFRPSRDWTSGFYPGLLWLLYSYTGDAHWQKNAEKITEFLADQQYNTGDHDVGFRIMCSYGNGWYLTGNPSYEKVIVKAAESLSTRYNKKTRSFMSWNTRPARDWKFPVIIDNMMNLELICEAAKLSEDDHFMSIVLAHADQTIKNHYRPDYSCPHVIDYDPETGEFRRADWNNGFSDPSIAVWSRGQSWGLYGFTMMYRETGEKRYLNHAEQIADFLLNHPNMPEDMVPYWDYAAPKIPTMRDASAAAILASALMELSTYASGGQKIFEAGEQILKSLSSPEYRAEPGENGNFILKKGTGNYLGGSEVNGPLIYADYYFIEGLLRYLKIINGQSIYGEY